MNKRVDHKIVVGGIKLIVNLKIGLKRIGKQLGSERFQIVLFVVPPI